MPGRGGEGRQERGPEPGLARAELIVEGRTSVDISGMALDRFGGRYPTRASLQKAAETTDAAYDALSSGYR